MQRILLLSAFILAAVQAHATITINSISGASNYTIQGNTTQPTTPGGTTTPATGSSGAIIYGGLAGYDSATTTSTNPGCTSTTGATVCDSCQNVHCADQGGTSLDPLCACNRARVYSGLAVGFSVTQNPASTFAIRAYSANTTGGTSGIDLQIIGTPSANGVSFQWSEVCRVLGTIDCEAITTANPEATVTIYIDKDNNGTYTQGEDHVDVKFKLVNPGRTDYNVYANGATEGAGDFTPWPGDDRVYLRDINTTSNFPNLSYGVQIAKVMIYLSKTSLAKANPKERDVEGSLDVDNTGGIGQNYVDDVENDTRYFMRIAMQDQAGNIVAFFPDLVGTDAKNLAHDADCNTAPSDACPFAVIPDQVQGILKNDFNCFIASAAYGTSMEPKLDLFRRFRNEVLFRYPLGRSFVWKYYAYGPYAARFIADKPVLRLMVRGVLWPLAGYAWLALKIGWIRSLVLCFSILGVTMLLPFAAARTRRKSQRA